MTGTFFVVLASAGVGVGVVVGQAAALVTVIWVVVFCETEVFADVMVWSLVVC